MGFGEGGGGARTKATHGHQVRGRRSHEAASAVVWGTLRLEGAPLQDQRAIAPSNRAAASPAQGLTMGRKGGRGNNLITTPRDAPQVSQFELERAIGKRQRKGTALSDEDELAALDAKPAKGSASRKVKAAKGSGSGKAEAAKGSGKGKGKAATVDPANDPTEEPAAKDPTEEPAAKDPTEEPAANNAAASKDGTVEPAAKEPAAGGAAAPPPAAGGKAPEEEDLWSDDSEGPERPLVEPPATQVSILSLVSLFRLMLRPVCATGSCNRPPEVHPHLHGERLQRGVGGLLLRV